MKYKYSGLVLAFGLLPFAHNPANAAQSGSTGNAAEAQTTPTAMDQATVAPKGSIRISAAVADSSLIHRVKPAYPNIIERDHAQATVVLEVWIGKDGRVHGARVVSGPPMLLQSSIDVVKQWRYKPYVLQGVPVDVDTTVAVKFEMGK